MPRVNRPASTEATRSKRCRRESHYVVLDASERRLLRSVGAASGLLSTDSGRRKLATRGLQP